MYYDAKTKKLTRDFTRMKAADLAELDALVKQGLAFATPNPTQEELEEIAERERYRMEHGGREELEAISKRLGVDPGHV